MISSSHQVANQAILHIEEKSNQEIANVQNITLETVKSNVKPMDLRLDSFY